MELTLHEAVPDICSSKTELGRVVINPPSMMGPLITKPTGTFYMCCTRAFLTEESYFKHLEEKETHGKAIDFSKLPRPTWHKEPNLDGSNFKLWYVRKHGCALKSKLEAEAKDLVESTDEKAEPIRASIIKGQKGRQKCTICNLFVINGCMKQHLQNSHVEDGIKCSYCPCAFLLRRSLLRHQRTAHGVWARKFGKSTNKFQKTIVARAKKQLVFKKVGNGRSSYDCSVCGKNLFNAVRLRDHMNTHTGARPYKCEQCGYRFSHISNLSRHMKKSHTKHDKFFCSTCKCSFSNNSLLKRHYKAMHPQKLKIKKLDSPEPKFKKRDTLSASPLSKKEGPTPSLLQTPTKDSSGFYECTVCQKKLTTTQTLRGHMLIHQNLKPYKCKFCGICFRLHSTVSQHIASAHSGGIFKCKQCTCRFKVLRALIRHVKVIHTELKENKKLMKTSEEKIKDSIETNKDSLKKKDLAGFKCNLCGLVVKTISEFNTHKNLHNGSNRTQCNLCLKSFGSAVNVKIHKMRAHGDDAIHVHKCTFCCCRYKASQALYSHLVKVHQMNRDDWNFTLKSIKPEACKRIQWSLLNSESNEDSNSTDFNIEGSQINESEITNSVGKSEGGKVQNLSKPFECDICHLQFKLRRSIGNHKKIAHNQGLYVCGLCPCRYHKLTWLEKHQLKIHGRLQLPKQKIQSVKVQSRHSLKSLPQVTKHAISRAKKFECELCKLKFVSWYSREKHQERSHFHSGEFQCSECPCKFMVLKGLELHRSLHHGYLGKKRLLARKIMNGHSDTFENSDSKIAMTNETELQESSQSLNDEASISVKTKYYECELCHIKFTQNGTLRNHKLKSHFHSGKFKCSKCSCKFLTYGGLINHKKLHVKHQTSRIGKEKVNELDKKREEGTAQTTSPTRTNCKNKNEVPLTETARLPGSGKFKCDLCGLMVAKGLWNHKKKSHRSGSHSCSDCTCVFETSQGLTRHRVVYHNSKRKTHDEAEESVHVNEENNADPEKPIGSPSKVNRNFLKIRGSFSPKKSKSKSSVSQVLNSPSKDTKVNGALYPTNAPRPTTSSPHYKFSCDLCGIKLTHSAYLRRHLRMAHSNGGIACDLCTCTFINGGALAAHKRIYHSPSHAGRVPIVKKLLKKSVKSRLTFERKAVVDTVVKSKKSIGKRNDASDSNNTTLSTSKENEVDKNSQSPCAKRKRTTMNSYIEPEIPPETSPQTLKVGEASLEESTSLKTLSKEQHQCKFCSKAFCNPRLLSKHILSHTKPEKCPHCAMAFRNKDEVTRHINVAHDESCIHQCFICSCRFSTETGLRRHQGIMHKDQPRINEDNIIIEEDDCAVSDSEPFLQVESTYSQRNIDENGFCEESVPIVQGILEASYLPNGDVVYTNGIGDQMAYSDAPESPAYVMHQDVQEFEEEEPVFHSVIEYDDSEVVYQEVLPSPSAPTSPKINPVARKKTFCSKTKPIKCSECEVVCQGPENLRMHMESHNEEQEQQVEPVSYSLPEDEESACETEPMEVDDSSKDIDTVKMKNCDKCSYEFATENDLTKHLESEHDESGLYRCAYCPCTMKTEINLRYHFMKYHSG